MDLPASIFVGLRQGTSSGPWPSLLLFAPVLHMELGDMYGHPSPHPSPVNLPFPLATCCVKQKDYTISASKLKKYG